MTFKGSKIVTDNTVLEHVNTFIYLRCKISYEEGKEHFYKFWEF